MYISIIRPTFSIAFAMLLIHATATAADAVVVDATNGNATFSANVTIQDELHVEASSSLGVPATAFAGNVVAGVQDGTTAISGQVGEVIEDKVSTATNAAASGSYLALASVTLPPGDWMISALAVTGPSSTPLYNPSGFIEALIGTTSAASTGCTLGYDWIQTKCGGGPSTQTNFTLSLPMKNVNISSTTTYYLNVLAAQSGSVVVTWTGSIMARRMR